MVAVTPGGLRKLSLWSISIRKRGPRVWACHPSVTGCTNVGRLGEQRPSVSALTVLGTIAVTLLGLARLHYPRCH